MLTTEQIESIEEVSQIFAEEIEQAKKEPKLLVKIKNQLKYRHVLDIGGPMAIYSYTKGELERKSFREAIPHILVAYNNIDDEELSFRSLVWTISINPYKEYIGKLNFVEKDIKGKIKTGIFVFEKDFSKIYIKTGYIEDSETDKADEVTKTHKILYSENTNVKIGTGEEFQDCLRGCTLYNEKAKSYYIVSAYMLEHREDLIDKILEAFSAYGNVADIIEDAPAYWIGPSGQIMSNFHIHIEAVIENPRLFGLTSDKIKEAYNKYNEPLGFEGKARVEIMETLIRNGWIRIRYDPKDDSYSLELNKLSGENSKYLQIWANGLLKASNGKRKYSEVKITEFDRDFQYTVHSVDDVVKWK